MKQLAIAVVLLGACKGESKPAGQTFAEGMALICGAADTEEARTANPADRQRVIAAWIDARVTNPEARNVFTAVGRLAVPEADRMLEAQARELGLDGCPLLRTLDPLASVELPEVGDLPLEAVPEDAIMVIASENAVVIEGTEVVAVRDGALDPAELDGGRVPKVRRFLEAMQADPVMLAVHPETRYDTLISLAGSFLPRAPSITLLARGAERPGAIPLHIPASTPRDDSMPAPAEEPLQMAVALQDGEAIVFSLSGLEGTLMEPLARVPAADAPARLRAVLGEIAKRRWEGRDRPADDRQIVVLADGALPASAVVPVLAAVRESFPDVLLGRGFE